jgi:hypothetical protein
MDAQIANYDEDRRHIAEAKSVDEVIEIRKRMDALVKYYKGDPEQKRKAKEIKLLAEVRIGEMVATLENKQLSGLKHGPVSPQGGDGIGKLEILKSAGITTQEASRFERLAELPRDKIMQAAKEGKTARQILEPKKQKPAPGREKARQAVRELVEAGQPVPSEKIAAELGISPASVERAGVAERARLETLEELKVDPSTLSMSAQAKLESAIRQRMKELNAEFEIRVAAEVKERVERRIDEYWMPKHQKQLEDAERIIKGRRGLMPRADYVKILACLHPDRVDPTLKDRFSEAFNLFKLQEVVLVSEKEMPTPTYAFDFSPERRRAAAEARKAKRKDGMPIKNEVSAARRTGR